MEKEVCLVPVRASEEGVLKSYIEALYEHDGHVDSFINIKEGVDSLLRNDALATPYFVKKGEIKVGYVILTRYHSVKKGGLTIFIDELFVEPEHRRQGIGKKMMHEILDIARGESARTLWAETEPFNEAAQSFFRSQGFRATTGRNFELPI